MIALVPNPKRLDNTRGVPLTGALWRPKLPPRMVPFNRLLGIYKAGQRKRAAWERNQAKQKRRNPMRRDRFGRFLKRGNPKVASKKRKRAKRLRVGSLFHRGKKGKFDAIWEAGSPKMFKAVYRLSRRKSKRGGKKYVAMRNAKGRFVKRDNAKRRVIYKKRRKGGFKKLFRGKPVRVFRKRKHPRKGQRKFVALRNVRRSKKSGRFVRRDNPRRGHKRRRNYTGAYLMNVRRRGKARVRRDNPRRRRNPSLAEVKGLLTSKEMWKTIGWGAGGALVSRAVGGFAYAKAAEYVPSVAGALGQYGPPLITVLAGAGVGTLAGMVGGVSARNAVFIGTGVVVAAEILAGVLKDTAIGGYLGLSGQIPGYGLGAWSSKEYGLRGDGLGAYSTREYGLRGSAIDPVSDYYSGQFSLAGY